ncbi:hypothetical protein Hypma_005503 [Hypsizygus marmoreus]|uniref:Uncharacterized protein n=1 Tax=Hypsizygus marmoreus TaxID=39966 RepID=A0A369IZ61_HYPMA|nr:hypothetical protein Hypma_005503 [Hypsizygus marmoreus]
MGPLLSKLPEEPPKGTSPDPPNCFLPPTGGPLQHHPPWTFTVPLSHRRRSFTARTLQGSLKSAQEKHHPRTTPAPPSTVESDSKGTTPQQYDGTDHHAAPPTIGRGHAREVPLHFY